MDERSANPLDSLLSVFVYAPIGFLLDARQLMPQLSTRGRQQVELLKVAAKFAVAKGKLDAEQKLRAARRPTASKQPAAHTETSAGETSAVKTSAVKTSPAKPPSARARTRPAEPAGVPKAKPAAKRGSVSKTAAASKPPIASYDTLSATQILPRLATLDRRNLDIVHDYERSHRGRRTILGRIEQLRAAAG